MKSYHSITALIFFFAFAKATLAQDQEATSRVEAPIIAVKIALGETAELEGQEITFVSVLEDSRCPEDVTCMWQGEIKFTIALSENGKNYETKTVVIQKPKSPIIFENSSIIIKAVAINPYPRTSRSKQDMSQELLLKLRHK